MCVLHEFLHDLVYDHTVRTYTSVLPRDWFENTTEWKAIIQGLSDTAGRPFSKIIVPVGNQSVRLRLLSPVTRHSSPHAGETIDAACLARGGSADSLPAFSGLVLRSVLVTRACDDGHQT